MIIPVILSGGAGTRLWPLSRKTYPKQLLNLVGDHSLLQETALRLKSMPEVSAPILIGSEDHYFISVEQLQSIDVAPLDIILEPCGRNTAPAIAIAALNAIEKDHNDPILLVMPADHMISDVNAFHSAITVATQFAEEGKLLTFGIVPTSPRTGYGYIKAKSNAQMRVMPIEKFVEKPSLETAQSYLKEGGYFWNSGMFMFRAQTYLNELQKQAPDIYESCQAAYQSAVRGHEYIRLTEETFGACRDESIDYAVMEKTQNAVVVPLAAGWADMGDWTSIADVHDADSQGNVIKGDVVAEDVCNSYLYSEDRLLAAVGLDNHIVIETQDAVLVAHKSRCQDVKSIVQQLKEKSHKCAESHDKVYRPWGYYETLSLSTNFQVKHIMVKPGAKLSLQMHQHRAEHWVVVDGIAEVERGEETYVLTKNESTYIPLKCKHRLTNIGDKPLLVIEVQSGDYLGEDDIIRFSDIYGRQRSKTETIAA